MLNNKRKCVIHEISNSYRQQDIVQYDQDFIWVFFMAPLFENHKEFVFVIEMVHYKLICVSTLIHWITVWDQLGNSKVVAISQLLTSNGCCDPQPTKLYECDK